MEEEIITPEEETFDYQKLRYILDKDGYVCHASLGGLIVCDLGECTEYNGEVPEDYETLIEWYDTQIAENKLNAWKIVKGNLIYDEYKYNELQLKFEKEEKENAPATKKYVDDKTAGISVSGSKELRNLFDKNTINDFKIAILNDSSNFNIEKLIINTHTNQSGISLIINSLNMLPNELLTQNKNGLSFNVLVDKDIEISGTSTSEFEIDLFGNDTNRISQLVFKKDVEYFLSGLDGIKLNMYYFDGTNRSQIYSGTGGSILFTDEDKLITQITLEFDNGTKIDKTIKPMLNLGSEALTYVKPECNKLNISLALMNYERLVFSPDLKMSEDLYLKYWGKVQLILENNKIIVIDDRETELAEVIMPSTFLPASTIYTLQDTTMSLEYVTNVSNGVPYDEVIKAINDSPEEIKIKADKIKLEGYTTINEGFSVDLDGNFNAKSGTIGGITTNHQGMFYSGSNANDGFGIWKGNIHNDGSGYIIFNAGGNTSNIGGSPLRIYQNGRIVASSGSIGSWNLSSNGIYGTSSAKAGLYTNGNMIMAGDFGMIKFDTNPVRITTASKLLISDSYSASEMASTSDSISIRAFSGQVHINSNYAVYAGSNRLDGSSSKAVKTNIKPMEEEYINDIYKAVKEMPLYTYDYLDRYGDKDDFGFIIEDIEDTCLNRTLKITQNQENELVKNYGTLELNKMNLVLIKELMNKIETLEKRIEELESDNNGNE